MVGTKILAPAVNSGYRVYSLWLVILVILASFLATIPLKLQPEEQSRIQPQLLQMAERAPDSRVAVIVQKGSLDRQPENEVNRLGGVVTRDLHVINAFAAELPARIVPALGQTPGIRWVSLDAPVTKSVTFSDRNNQAVQNAYLDAINIGSTWNTYKGDGVGVAIVDSGINPIDDFYIPNTATSRLTVSVNAYDSAPTGVGSVLAYEAEQTITTNTIGGTIISDNQFSATKGVDFNSANNWACFTVNITKAGNYTFHYRVKKTANSGKFQLTINGVDSGAAQDFYASTATIATINAGTYSFPLGYDTICYRSVGKNSASTGIHGFFDNFQFIGQTGTAIAINSYNTNDDYGHGTHIAGIVGGAGRNSGSLYVGVAPHTNLINVKISDSNGVSRMSGVVAGLQWIFDNYNTYKIKVVNISLNSSIPESYNTSPLCAAAEMLWFKGIVVVTSAGNTGSQGLLPPANDPFVITVGATDDKGTASISDDTMASFSSYGTTVDGFAKPDLVAPGTKIMSVGSPNSYLNKNYPGASTTAAYIKLSGTSMAAPMVSGAAALILQANPNLTPNQVKYRLLSTARPFDTTARAGAGYLNVNAAVTSTSTTSQPSNYPISKLLNPVFGYSASATVSWSTVSWSTVNWSSVSWSTVNWSSVSWSTVNWSSDYWGS